MSTRQSRSASIPIPPSSVARSLESVIPMSFNPGAPSRPRLSSVGASTSPLLARSVPHPTRSASASYASAIATSPRGRTAGPAQSTPAPLFEPRIIRATPSPNLRETPCNPPYSPSSSPTRTRRLSSGFRAQGSHHPSIPTHRAPVPTHVSHATPQGFPRPTYLEYSSLRDMLHTDTTPSTLAATARPATYSIATYDSRASSSPAPTATSYQYPYMRRELTPVVDTSDEESTATSSPPSVGAVTVISTTTVLMLPTRWSEQDRHPSLSVSLDGRELTFTGPSCMGDRDSSAARANHPVPPACGIYYYEVEILHRCPQGCVAFPTSSTALTNLLAGPSALGKSSVAWAGRDVDALAERFSAPDVRLSRLPGWEKNSWGYHADDGYSFPGQKEGNLYGPKFDSECQSCHMDLR